MGGTAEKPAVQGKQSRKTEFLQARITDCIQAAGNRLEQTRSGRHHVVTLTAITPVDEAFDAGRSTGQLTRRYRLLCMRTGMSDAGADPGLETVEHPSSLTPVNQSHRRRLWPRIAGVFRTSDWTALFTGVLAIATIALVGTSIWLHTDTVEVLKATNRLAEATEKAAADRRQTASAEFILKIDAMLEEHRYDRITDDIQSHDSNYQLPKYKNKSDADVN